MRSLVTTEAREGLERTPVHSCTFVHSPMLLISTQLTALGARLLLSVGVCGVARAPRLTLGAWLPTIYDGQGALTVARAVNQPPKLCAGLVACLEWLCGATALRCWRSGTGFCFPASIGYCHCEPELPQSHTA